MYLFSSIFSWVEPLLVEQRKRLWGRLGLKMGFKMVFRDVFPFENSIFCKVSERKAGGRKYVLFDVVKLN